MNKALSIAMVSSFQLTLWEALQSVEVFIGGEGFCMQCTFVYAH